MRTQAQPAGDEFSAWHLRGLWGVLSGLLKHGESDFHRAIPDGRGRAGVSAARAQSGVTLTRETQRLPPRRIDRGRILRSNSGRHLWLLLRSKEHRGAAFWETACFLAIWLSGIIGVAICVL